MRYHIEFLELNGRGTLAKLFKALSDKETSWLLHLCAVAKVKKMSISQIIDTSTANTIPRIESNTLVVRNNNSISYSNKAPNQYHHSYLSSKSDHCPACFEREILTMSKMYFEMLRKQITDEIMTTISKENLSGF
jgi:DNA-directed RNA polymerase subunit M/transcription elongation factor TFIIS